MNKMFFALGTLITGLGVVLGAFGAHKLKEIAPESVPTFQTGVQYQMYHGLALILVAIVSEKLPAKYLSLAGWAFLLGILLFSGSLYALSILKATGKVGLGGLGIITPVGGLFFILGWIAFFLAALRG